MANHQLWHRQLCGYVLLEGIPADPSCPTRGAAKDDLVFTDVEV
jgi:rubrerythrin